MKEDTQVDLPTFLKYISQLSVDNSTENFEFIAEGSGADLVVRSEKIWSQLNEKYNGN
ncbi:hypothetical protein [Reichenbachiella sp. 5M10]|uniref:hypothetical protein n=1 Tax=Reichenbachiella sp. 5M10 TaxID=1889772 RepID=UPI001C8822AC|nr:hypothetical protein [Reichenbachiella sp. 5M10]